MSNSGDFAIGSNVWPGTAKVITVMGKLIATKGQVRYWDGKPLDERLVEELADLLATLEFFIETNMTWPQREAIVVRARTKLLKYRHWHEHGNDELPKG